MSSRITKTSPRRQRRRERSWILGRFQVLVLGVLVSYVCRVRGHGRGLIAARVLEEGTIQCYPGRIFSFAIEVLYLPTYFLRLGPSCLPLA